MTPARHHSVYPGKRVSVKLTNGAVIVAKFLARDDRYCRLEGQPRIPWKKVRSMQIYRNGDLLP